MEIELSKIPMRGCNYRHHSGRVYHVLSVANMGEMKPGWLPPIVAYADIETNVEYARPLSEWIASGYTLTD